MVYKTKSEFAVEKIQRIKQVLQDHSMLHGLTRGELGQVARGSRTIDTMNLILMAKAVELFRVHDPSPGWEVLASKEFLVSVHKIKKLYNLSQYLNSPGILSIDLLSAVSPEGLTYIFADSTLALPNYSVGCFKVKAKLVSPRVEGSQLSYSTVRSCFYDKRLASQETLLKRQTKDWERSTEETRRTLRLFQANEEISTPRSKGEL